MARDPKQRPTHGPAPWLWPELRHVAPERRQRLLERAKLAASDRSGWLAPAVPPVMVGVLLVCANVAIAVHRTPLGSALPKSLWILLFVAAGISGVLLLAEAVTRRHTARELRLMLNLCPACGYELDGNESGTCPECGKPVQVRGL